MKIVVPVVAATIIAFSTPAMAMIQEEAPGVEEAEEDPDQRVRCQTRRVTGSNARRIRTCLTIAEWRELAQSGNRDARRILDDTTRDSMQRN
ncbi:hypothetical protein [Parasphingopyxis sp.]|uniref:hypothetical protein n=1 Tax=Parasphingopyxis sp. TaxID=1920299 RepID=UPI002622B5E3|nr:hypothetical protein [Parasphingopyxis sp.]